MNILVFDSYNLEKNNKKKKRNLFRKNNKYNGIVKRKASTSSTATA